jgi:hypothetical protein
MDRPSSEARTLAGPAQIDTEVTNMEVVTEEPLTLAQVDKWNEFGVLDERPS